MLRGMIADGLRFLSGVDVKYSGFEPLGGVKVFFSNHTSHLDFIYIWAALPHEIRKNTIPVGARDYWDSGVIKRFLAKKIFRAALINRKKISRVDNPLEELKDKLNKNFSLIIFPEGTRGNDGSIGTFKSGIFHLAKLYPEVEFVPVYICNSHRVLPKGEFLPVPMLSSVCFGSALTINKDESKQNFLARMRTEIENLRENNHEFTK